jgi:hypothetical protein
VRLDRHHPATPKENDLIRDDPAAFDIDDGNPGDREVGGRGLGLDPEGGEAAEDRTGEESRWERA